MRIAEGYFIDSIAVKQPKVVPYTGLSGEDE